MLKTILYWWKIWAVLFDKTSGGAISSSSQNILNRLNIPTENWLKITTEFGALFKGAVGALPALTEYCEHLDRKRRQGAANCQRRLCA